VTKGFTKEMMTQEEKNHACPDYDNESDNRAQRPFEKKCDMLLVLSWQSCTLNKKKYVQTCKF
jgi:hypothetical protein